MTDSLLRLSTALADRYEIQEEIGAGGMATVYLAHDVKHDRKVALKVLRPELAAVIGAERFLQEIKVTANLQHPHILPLHDSGEADSFLYYVMPLVEGESLRERLHREKQLPVGDALEITKAVASALDYAHRHGVIHRDIKPENVLLHDGQALIADFGIALAVSQAGGTRLTETGLSVGTPHYMSPEQAMGDRELDARSDVYSLGAMLYEMMVGEPPFTGPTAQAIVAKVLTEKAPHVSTQRSTVPPHVDAAVQTALEKMPADRFASAGEFSQALGDQAYTVTLASVARAAGMQNLWKRRAIAAIGVAAIMTVLFAWSLVRPRSEPVSSAMRFAFSMGSPSGARLELAISPDGQSVAQAYTDSAGQQRLVVRDFATTTIQTVAGTAGGRRPFFSPDGEWIGFDDENLTLKKVPATGGAALDITDSCWDGSWAPDDVIVCVSSATWGLARVSANSGDLEQLTLPDTANGEIAHWEPQVLPDGNAVLFTSYRRPTTRIEAYDLETDERTVLIEPAVMARYSPTGHLLYVNDGALFAIRFDAKRLRTEGSAIPLLTDVAAIPSDAVAGFAVASNGTLVVVRASEWDTQQEVVWVDRTGRETPTVVDPGDYEDLRLAPDERRFVVTNTAQGERQIWVYDFVRRAMTQLTRGMSALRPAWTADSREVLFTNETPSYDIYRIPIDGSAPAQPVVENVHDKYPESVSPNGEALAYEDRWDANSHIMFAILDGSSTPTPFADSSMSTSEPTFSPDGRWLAYVGVTGARSEVYVQAVDGSGGRLQVSVQGGAAPRWTRNGREIVYRWSDVLYAVSVDPGRREVGAPSMLFRGRYTSLDATADGNRFLALKPIERPGALPLLVWFNWVEEFGAR